MIEAIENGTESVTDQTYDEMMASLSRSADRKRQKELEEAVQQAVQEEADEEEDGDDALDSNGTVPTRKHRDSMTAWYEQMIELSKHGLPPPRKGQLNSAIAAYVENPNNKMHAVVRNLFKEIIQKESRGPEDVAIICGCV